MKMILYILLCFIALGSFACQPPPERGVALQEGVGSDTLVSNIVTKPVLYAFSVLIGEQIEVKEAITYQNKDGFMQLEVRGYNRSFDTKRFEYKVEWLDKSGMLIDSATNKWILFSVAGRSPFTIQAVAPRNDAVDFRMNTRKAQD